MFSWETFGPGHSSECHIDTHQPPKHCRRSSTPSLAMALPDGSGLSQQDVSRHTTNTAQEWPEEHHKDLKVSAWPPNSPEPNPIEHLWDVPDLALTCGHNWQLVGGGGSCPVVSGTRALVVDPLKVCRCCEVVRLICDSVWVVRVKLAST